MTTSQAQESVLAPDSGLTRQVNNEPAIHFILLGDEGSRAVGVLGGRRGAEEEAGEALEHDGGVKRPQGAALWQCRNLGGREESEAPQTGLPIVAGDTSPSPQNSDKGIPISPQQPRKEESPGKENEERLP